MVASLQRLATPLLFVAPILILATTFYFVPVFKAFMLSLQKWLIITGQDPEFVGLANYRELFGERRFKIAFWNTVYYAVGTVPIGVAISLGLALLLDAPIQFKAGFRAIFFIPVIIPRVVVAMIWGFMFGAYGGAVNQILQAFGAEPVRWLANPDTAMNAIIVTSLWGGVGFNMVIFLAGLQSIPNEYHEAARVEGANLWQQFVHITFPLLRPTLLFAVVIATIASFQVFTQVFVMTEGGPAFSTTTLVYYIYVSAFEHFRMGYAAAVAVILFLGLLLLSLIQLRLLRSDYY